jgi:DNA-binding response OmpR family regulator
VNGVSSPATVRYLESLSTYVDALESARAALPASPASVESIKRMAATLETSSGRHGFPAVESAARAARNADPPTFAPAVDRLLYALLNAVAVPSSRERTVLVVDDDVVQARLFQQLLERAGRAVVVATKAAGILEVLKSRWIDLVIMDIGLPDLDGREVLAALRNNPITSQIPVLIVSDPDPPWLESECLALGANRFLSKPVNPGEVDRVVTALLAPRPDATAPTAGQPVSRSAGAAPPATAAGPEGREILLAEHDPLTAQIIKHRLGREGFQIRHFTSGTAALQAARSLAPAAVIVDAMTPGIDGIELLIRLRQLDHYKTLPVVVLSDIGSEREVVRALEAGADDCIRKPFSPTELVARIGRLLARK